MANPVTNPSQSQSKKVVVFHHFSPGNYWWLRRECSVRRSENRNHLLRVRVFSKLGRSIKLSDVAQVILMPATIFVRRDLVDQDKTSVATGSFGGGAVQMTG